MRPWESIADRLAPTILDSGVVPGPPEGPFEPGVPYPLAVDVDGDIGAVSYAIHNMYPDIHRGWWCVAVAYFRGADGTWGGGQDHDNSTTDTPFARPAVATNSKDAWVDWVSIGGIGDYGGGAVDDDPGWRHGFFGIAPQGTERIVLVQGDGRRRDLRITPWCGAFVADVEGETSTIEGYGTDGVCLGTRELSTPLDSDATEDLFVGQAVLTLVAPPPDGLPAYRLLTGPDDDAFCRRVSEALALGYRLHGSPSVTFDGERVIAAQAVVWPGRAGTDGDLPA